MIAGNASDTLDDQAYCWGEAGYYYCIGAPGCSQDVGSSTPVAVDTSGVLNGKTVKQVMAGHEPTYTGQAGHEEESCLLASDDQLYCWGFLGNGVTVGADPTFFSNTPEPYPLVETNNVLASITITQIEISPSGTACVLSSDGLAYCWGDVVAGRDARTLRDGIDSNCGFAFSGLLPCYSDAFPIPLPTSSEDPDEPIEPIEPDEPIEPIVPFTPNTGVY
jgi:hypothetical protein